MLTWRNYIEEILEFIHPYFCKSSVIFIDNLPCASWKRVGCSFPKHMSNMWASNNLQSSSTLPNLETATKKTRFKHRQLKKNCSHLLNFMAGISQNQGCMCSGAPATWSQSQCFLNFWFWSNQKLKAKFRKDVRSRAVLSLTAVHQSYKGHKIQIWWTATST